MQATETHYEPSVLADDLVFISGRLPYDDDGGVIAGLIGDEITVDDARQAARRAAESCLRTLRAVPGGQDASVLRVTGYVAARPGFTRAHQIVDAASEHIRASLGERGKHSRVAVAVSGLPLGACVEIEMVAKRMSSEEVSR